MGTTNRDKMRRKIRANLAAPSRREQVQARVDARRAARAVNPSLSKIVSRKERGILLPSGGLKQRYKHLARRSERRQKSAAIAYASVLEKLLASIAKDATCPRPASVEFIGSSVPFIAYGQISTGERWSFRYRFDRAFLEVGQQHETFSSIVGECRLAASRVDVSGEPYAGWLATNAAVTLIAELFAELETPPEGSLFKDRLSNSLERLTVKAVCSA